MTNPTPRQSAAQRQLHKYAEALRQRAYEVPELRDDDVPAHLRNSPNWVQLIGER